MLIQNKHYYINETGCWLWLLQIDKYGYGVVKRDGKKQLAHRYSYKLKNGDITKETHLHHKCEITRCVNVDHLEAMSRSAHSTLHAKQESSVKRLKEYNDSNKHSLSQASVQTIRQLLFEGKSFREIAKQFNVYYNTIYCIAHGITHN